MEKILTLVFMIAAGLFSIFCAVMNYNWFIGHRKAQFFVRIIGRTGTRIFYIVLGAFLILMALLMYRSGQI